MFPNLRTLIFLVLTVAMLSCRSHKEVQSEVVVNTATVSVSESARDSTVSLLTAFKTAAAVEISGLVVEFTAPDSSSRDIRAAPKSLRVDRLAFAHSADSTFHLAVDVSDQKTVNLKADSATVSKQQSNSQIRAFSPPGVLNIILIGASVLILLWVWRKYKRINS